MYKITINKLKKWECCYSTEELKSIFGNKKYFTPIEVARKRSVSIEDRIWVLLRPEILGVDLPLVMDEIVGYVVKKNCLKCGVAEVEKWAEKWLSGEDRSYDSAYSAWSAA